MRWTDQGIITSARPFGEKGLIVTILTQSHGLYKGLIRSKSATSVAQPGTCAHATWSARLPEQLGSWTLEPTNQPIALLMNHPLQLSALNAACSLLEVTIPERELAEGAFSLLNDFIKACLVESSWREAYLAFEKSLLSLMGFEMKLTECAATGATDNLIYISPKSGKSVSAQAGEPYKKKLFHLSQAFVSSSFSLKDLESALKTLSYFWKTFVLTPHGASSPPARDRLISSIARRAL